MTGISVCQHQRQSMQHLTCWCFCSISISCPSTFVCFSLTLTSSSSLACISSSCLVTCSKGFTWIRRETSSRHVPGGICSWNAVVIRGGGGGCNFRQILFSCGHRKAHLSEESPPLPVTQLQVRSTVSLENLERTKLLLFLGKGSEVKRERGGKKKNETQGMRLPQKSDAPLLACKIAATSSLEVNNDVCDLQVPLFLQVGQHSRPEEDFALADAKQVVVKLQGFDLAKKGNIEINNTETVLNGE